MVPVGGVGGVGHFNAICTSTSDRQSNAFMSAVVREQDVQRRQRMVVNGQISETLPILPGVPQGYVIGPLLS